MRLWGVAERFKPANPRSPTPSTSAHLGRCSTGLHELAGPDPPSLSAVPGQPRAATSSRGWGGKDEVGKTEPDLKPSANAHLEGGFSAQETEASCTRAKGAGRLGPLAFPVTGSAPASPSPAAAGPFPESLKRREDWGAALPLAQKGGGAGRKGGRTRGVPRTGQCCRGYGSPVKRRKRTSVGQSNFCRPGLPAFRSAPEHPPSPHSRGGSAREAGVSPPLCRSPGALGTCP